MRVAIEYSMQPYNFLVVGPGIISGPYSQSQYEEVFEFIAGVQEALGLPMHKLGDWMLCWDDVFSGPSSGLVG